MAADPRTELSNQLAQTLKDKGIDSSEKREITVTFRVSQSEKNWLEQRCQGVAQSDYIRAKLFDYSMPRPRRTIPEVNRQVVYELKRIGNNINQQTRDINTVFKRKKTLGSTWDYLITLKEVTSLIKQCVKDIARLSECDGNS